MASYAWDRVLLCATGGAAFMVARSTDVTFGVSTDRTIAGWTVGGGLEYGFTNNYRLAWSTVMRLRRPGLLMVILGLFRYTERFRNLGVDAVRGGLAYRSDPIAVTIERFR